MKKEEAQKRLTAIESEVKELRKIIQDSDAPREITERIKTFEDACEYLEIKTYRDAYRVLKLSRVLLAETLIERCEDEELKLMIICRALNEDWIPNWENRSEYKYYPYFKMSPFGFAGTVCGGWGADAYGGSRLCFKSEKIAKYAGTQFASNYKKVLTF